MQFTLQFTSTSNSIARKAVRSGETKRQKKGYYKIVRSLILVTQEWSLVESILKFCKDL